MHAAEDACLFRRVPTTPRRSAPCSADGGLALPRMYVASWPHFRRIWETAQKRVAVIRQHTTWLWQYASYDRGAKKRG